MNPSTSIDEPADPGPGARTDGELYRLLVERAEVGLFVIVNRRFRFVNPRLAKMLGYTPEELTALDPIEMTVPEDRPIVIEHMRRTAEGEKEAEAYEIRCQRKDGSRLAMRVWSSPIEINGATARLVSMQDVTELRANALAAERRAMLLAQAEELALIGSSEFDVATGRVHQSPGMFRIFGEPVVEGDVGGEWLMQRVPAGEAPFLRTLLEGVRPDVPCEFEHRILHTDGQPRTVLHRAIAEMDGQGHATRVISLLQDITAQRQAEHQRDLLVHSDSITRLPNRHALLDRLDAAVRQARRESRPLALLALEIDQLRAVTDSLGYAAGDRLLTTAAERLTAALDPQHLLAHMGSGRYAVLLTECRDDEVIGIAERLLAAFDAPFAIEAAEVVVRGAVGIAVRPTLDASDDDAAAQLLNQAEAAMGRAAEAGGARRVCVYSAEAHAQAAHRLSLEAALRHALERNEFELHYQPQMDLQTGAMLGAEALLRWRDPVHGTVAPSEFIPLAEETGLILPLGDWVLRTACAQNLAWQRAGLPPIRVSVNLSVRQLEQPDLAARIKAVLSETGLDPRYLGVELTESVMVIDSELVARTLGQLRALGVEISLDDFGTGYSNLGYLRTLPIDVVKVDRSLVHDVTAAPQDVSLTRAVINMARALNIKVLAEGVETEGQLALLIANRCDQMQGHFFSPPVAPDTLAQILGERRALPEHLLQRRPRERTLLVVDDEDNIVAALKRLLRRDGYHIVTANSGAQGLQRLAEHKVDVILSDQRMPGMTGVEFLRRAKELYPETVRMVLSGYTELQSITDAINEGAIYKFLTKPWDDERLRGHIAEAFRHKEMGDDNRRLGAQVQQANEELAQVNERLQRLLASQKERIDREQGSLDLAHEMLFSIPAAVIGIDPDGMIAFANEDAQRLFDDAPALLGSAVRHALPTELVQLWRDGGPAPRRVRVRGAAYRAACRPLGGDAGGRGKLLLLAHEGTEAHGIHPGHAVHPRGLA